MDSTARLWWWNVKGNRILSLFFFWDVCSADCRSIFWARWWPAWRVADHAPFEDRSLDSHRYCVLLVQVTLLSTLVSPEGPFRQIFLECKPLLLACWPRHDENNLRYWSLGGRMKVQQFWRKIYLKFQTFSVFFTKYYLFWRWFIQFRRLKVFKNHTLRSLAPTPQLPVCV